MQRSLSVSFQSFTGLGRVSALVGLFTVALIMRLYALDDLPGELYGDIAIIYELVRDIHQGRWPIQFVLSNGPLYGYLIAPIIAITGPQGYLGYKLSSVLVSLLGVVATFFLLRFSFPFGVAVFGSLTLAASSWFLIFSRLGNAQVLIPAITAGCYALLLAGKRGRPWLVSLGFAVSLLGLYAMPQTFILPLAYLASAWLLFGLGTTVRLVVGTLLISVPFVTLVVAERDLFFNEYGYIGGKAATEGRALDKIWSNLSASALMFHVAGDRTFRSNPPGQPQLDVVNGVLLLVGLVVSLVPPSRLRIAALWIPFLALQIPANLVLSEVSPTPSASRTIGILPFVAYAVALGISLLLRPIPFLSLRLGLLASLAVAIIALNWERYFEDYATHLPNQNTPFGKMIAAEVDALPPGAGVIMYRCCWGQAGQPEPNGVEYVVRQPSRISYVDTGRFSCELMASQTQPVFVIWDPREINAPVTPKTCDPPMRPEVRLGPHGDVAYVMFSPP
jgi:hypothetical protein